MKRIFLLFAFCTLCLTGCMKSFKEIKVDDFELLSISPRGFSGVDAKVKFAIDNPAMAFSLSDIHAYVKMNGDTLMVITTDPVSVKGHGEDVLEMGLRGDLSKGINPFQLMTVLYGKKLDSITADVSARANVRSGIGKNIEYKDVNVGKLLGEMNKK